MGPLTLPAHGPVYLDANGFIYSVERVEPYRTLLAPMWRQAQAGEFDVASSDITVLETLVKPLREGDEVVEMLLRSMFDAHEVNLTAATREPTNGRACIGKMARSSFRGLERNRIDKCPRRTV